MLFFFLNRGISLQRIFITKNLGIYIKNVCVLVGYRVQTKVLKSGKMENLFTVNTFSTFLDN